MPEINIKEKRKNILTSITIFSMVLKTVLLVLNTQFWTDQHPPSTLSHTFERITRHLESIIAETIQPYLNKSHNWFPFLTTFLVG